MGQFFEWWYDTAVGTNYPDTEDYVLAVIASLGVLAIGTLVSFLLLCLVIASKGIVLIPLAIVGGMIYGLVLEGRKRKS